MSDTPGPGDWLTVVGVANDVMQDGPMERHSTIYLPSLQSNWTFLLSHMSYVVRTDRDGTVRVTVERGRMAVSTDG